MAVLVPLAVYAAVAAYGYDGQPYLRNIRIGFEVDKPELRVTIDRSRAASLGVSIEDISRTMQILFGGLDLSRIKVGGKEYYVMAQLARESRLTPQDLDKIFVRNNKGDLIQLSSIVTRTQGAAPNAITHYGRLRSSSITASPGIVPIGTVVKEVEALLTRELPPGFLYAWGGDAKSLSDASTEFWWLLGLASIIVYMTLAAQFESLVHPLTVMLSLPLAFIGAFGLLWVLDWGGDAGLYPPIPAMNFNLFSQIGLVLLGAAAGVALCGTAAAQELASVGQPISADIITPDFVSELRTQLQQPVTILSVDASNKRHDGVQQAEIDKLDEAWKTEAKSGDQPLIAEILSSPLSSYLLYTQAKSAGLFTEIFIMDKFGLNVGQSSVTSDYWQGDEAKFQKTFQVGPDAVFIDEPEYHDETKTWRVQVNLTIVDPASKAAIGAATAEINLTELQRRLQTGI